MGTTPTTFSGTDVLAYITYGCQSLLATSSPTLDVIGMRMLLGLATIMMVWFGVQEALSAAQGGPGFHMGRFLNFVMLIGFAYVFVYYYDSAIPGVGYSLTGWISKGTSSIADSIGTDAANTMLKAIHTTQSQQGPAMTLTTSPYLAMVYTTTQVMLSTLSALISSVIGYGEIAATICVLLGPIFIPWMVFDKTEFLFWGWLKAYLGFEFYKVVAAAAMTVLGHFFSGYYQGLATTGTDLKGATQNFPILILLIVINIFVLIKIPAMTSAILSGNTGAEAVSSKACSKEISCQLRIHTPPPPPAQQNGIWSSTASLW